MKSMEETISYRALPEIPGLEILSARNSSRLWRLYHETYSICAVRPETRGRSEWVYRGRSYESSKKSLIIVEPGEVHAMQRIHGPGSFDVMMVSLGLVEKFAYSLGIPSAPHLSVASTSQVDVTEAFLGFHRALSRGACGMEVESRFIVSLSKLLKSCAERKTAEHPAPPSAAISKAKDFLRAHWDRNVTLEELSSVAGLSKYHLLRGFCRFIGVPPHAYQIQLRVLKAQGALLKGARFSELGLKFSDQSHFIRSFKKIIGVTPGRYAAMVRAS